MKEPSKFSLDEFKRWMKENSSNSPLIERPKNPLIGIQVESKISFKRLLEKILDQNGDLEEIAHDFHKNGGTILESEDKRFCIEVKSGSFFIHRAYVTRT